MANDTYGKTIIAELVRAALAEDIGPGDVTSSSVLTGEETGIASAVAKADVVAAGIDVFREVFLSVDADLSFTALVSDGESVQTGSVMAEIRGRLRSILMGERVALNLFQRMCGIATASRQFVEAVAGTKAKILDTRKTAPGLRILDKYAVRTGGAVNHRFALFDGVLIKDNHIAAAGGITPAIQRARAHVAHTMKIEIEVRNQAELEEALAAAADIIMLDYMSPEAMTAAVAFVNGRVPLEASGNITLNNVRQVARTGVDLISVGALTHSVTAADISLMVRK